MAVIEVLQLGNLRLYEKSEWVKKGEVPRLGSLVRDLHDTLINFRNRYGAGRAIAAPQIGVMKRLIYMHIEKPTLLLNPVLDRKSRDRIEVWDDCMCFPDLLVKVNRRRRCRVSYRDGNWKECELSLEGDLSELLQHEVDHLDGILAVSRAIDKRSFALRSQKDLTGRTVR
jgi:peptide deformylase